VNIVERMGKIGESVYSFLGKDSFKLLSLSLLSTRTIPRGVSDRLSRLIRFKIHPMFFWSSGFFKTSIMNFFKEVATSREEQMNFIHSSRKVSEASFRGSVENGSFVPPTILKAPVIFFPEFSTVLSMRDSDMILADIRSVLEEPEFSVEMNSFASISDEERERANESYGVDIVANELKYKWDGIMGIAIHELSPDIIKKCDISFWRRFTTLNYPSSQLDNNDSLMRYVRQNQSKIMEAPNLANEWLKYLRITIPELPSIPRSWDR